MAKKTTVHKAHPSKDQSASSQAGEFVREEIERVRAGEHGVRNTKQAIAIGLSKARRAGVKLPAPKKGSVPESSRRQAKRELAKTPAQRARKPSARRSAATTQALKRESTAPASKAALSRHSQTVAAKRSAGDRSASARKAARTRGRRP